MISLDNKRYGSIFLLLLKHPLVLLVFLLIFVIGSLLIISIGFFTSTDSGISDETLKNKYKMCTPIEQQDETKFWNNYIKQFSGKGKLDKEGYLFRSVANKYDIDPVLLASIVFYETNEGTSKLLKENNNVGRMKDSQGNFLKYSSLLKGVEAFAKYIFEEYIEKGLVTINQIGQKRAPIEDSNDSTFNSLWIPKVTQYAKDLGGLILNCNEVNFGNGQFGKPIPNIQITSNFGSRVDPFTGQVSFHKGVDFGAGKGTMVYSAEAGKVVDVVRGCVEGNMSCGGGYGNRILIRHQEGLYTLYAHLTDVFVDINQNVSRSQPIGTVGTTGQSTGYHLHFEVQLSMFGERVDPMPYLENEGE